MMEESIKETARQRAMRIWRNHYIQHHTTNDQDPLPINESIEEDTRINKFTSSLKREISSIINEHNYRSIAYYIILIKQRRRKLLQEKLRRLKQQEDQI
jgi:hypothetical protein